MPIATTRQEALKVIRVIQIRLPKVTLSGRTTEEYDHAHGFREPEIGDVNECKSLINSTVNKILDIEMSNNEATRMETLITMRIELAEKLKQYLKSELANMRVRNLHYKIMNVTQLITLIQRCIDALLGTDTDKDSSSCHYTLKPAQV